MEKKVWQKHAERIRNQKSIRDIKKPRSAQMRWVWIKCAKSINNESLEKSKQKRCSSLEQLNTLAS